MGSKLTKGAASDGVIKISDAGAGGSQVQVILVLQALEQVGMLLEDVAQRARQVLVVDLVETNVEVVIRNRLQVPPAMLLTATKIGNWLASSIS